jgi:hypothetical protein
MRASFRLLFHKPAQAELVEALSFFIFTRKGEGQPFDKLRVSGWVGLRGAGINLRVRRFT